MPQKFVTIQATSAELKMNIIIFVYFYLVKGEDDQNEDVENRTQN